MQGQGEYSVIHTAPYKSSDGNGLIISGTVPIHSSDGQFRGVAGTDLQLPQLQEIVNAITECGQGGTSCSIRSSPVWLIFRDIQDNLVF